MDFLHIPIFAHDSPADFLCFVAFSLIFFRKASGFHWISEVSGLKAILASPELELVAGNQVGMG